MSPYVHEWLNLLIRWAHIIAAIMWIGDSLFFMWLDSSLERDADAPDHQVGGLWMVHSGGFYRVEKLSRVPGGLPPKLHWFKWEATSTWVTGFLLLLVVYYHGGALVDLDKGVGLGTATAIGLGLLPVSWLLYDLFFQSPLGTKPAIAVPVSAIYVAAVAYFLTENLSGRAAYIHVGAMFGTLMVANVWMRILPAQRKFLAAAAKGETPDPEPGKNAKRRSVHNNYMTFPVIFIMISNHFPTTTYGYHWAMLCLCMLGGAGVRYWFNNRDRASGLVAAVSLAVMFGGAYVLFPSPPADVDEPVDSVEVNQGAAGDPPQAVDGTPPAGEPAGAKGAAGGIDPAITGVIRGTVRFEGPVPPREPVKMSEAACAAAHPKPPLSEALIVTDTKVANAFVRITEGLEDFEFTSRRIPVTIDQKGCVYSPHVVGVMTKQKVVFVNSDPTLHNIHTFSERNRDFNIAMPTRGQRIIKKFKRPEVMVQTKCDVHPWMVAYIGVMDHPFFAVTKEDGAFELSGVPMGTYQLEAWHETLGVVRATVEVKRGEVASPTFVFPAKAKE